jgi:DNA (cytosine-5)-methyltransferase 1
MLKKNTPAIIDETFIVDQLNSVFSKIKIIDNSVDKDEIQRQLINYYQTKFSNLDLVNFHYDFIDLFCGAGGLSAGLEQEGFRPVVAVDKDRSAALTYRFNRPWLTDASIIHDDIRELVDQDIFPHVPVIVGGPPCQGFSVVNKHKKENDERNSLYRFYVHYVEQALPDVFLMENVEGILQLYDKIKKDFSKVGYITCEPLVLNTKDFGFPQSRKRAFILGIKKDYKKISSELYQLFKAGLQPHMDAAHVFTLWDAIKDLPPLEAKTMKNATYSESAAWGYTFAGFLDNESEYAQLVNRGLPNRVPLLNHRSKYNNDRDIQIYQLLRPGEKSDAESIQEINPYKNRASIFRDKFDKLLADEPCKAITAHMYYDCNMYIHPYQARGLTPREAARVQGFPDDYLFLGSPNEWYRQIGNAVSPLMARVLASGLKQVLERIYRV